MRSPSSEIHLRKIHFTQQLSENAHGHQSPLYKNIFALNPTSRKSGISPWLTSTIKLISPTPTNQKKDTHQMPLSQGDTPSPLQQENPKQITSNNQKLEVVGAGAHKHTCEVSLRLLFDSSLTNEAAALVEVSSGFLSFVCRYLVWGSASRWTLGVGCWYILEWGL